MTLDITKPIYYDNEHLCFIDREDPDGYVWIKRVDNEQMDTFVGKLDIVAVSKDKEDLGWPTDRPKLSNTKHWLNPYKPVYYAGKHACLLEQVGKNTWRVSRADNGLITYQVVSVGSEKSVQGFLVNVADDRLLRKVYRIDLSNELRDTEEEREPDQLEALREEVSRLRGLGFEIYCMVKHPREETEI